MKYNIVSTTIIALLVNHIVASPVMTFLLIHFLLVYISYKLLNIGQVDIPGPDAPYIYFIMSTVPYVLIPLSLICDRELIIDEIKEKYPNFQLPSFRSPIYFKK